MSSDAIQKSNIYRIVDTEKSMTHSLCPSKSSSNCENLVINSNQEWYIGHEKTKDQENSKLE